MTALPPRAWCAMAVPTINLSKASPNYSSREGASISMIVLHASAGSFGSALSWLCSAASRVSAHYLIGKTGVVYQLVMESHAAWHAGKSAWRGLDSTVIQQQSIGIELANANDGIDPYPTVQIDSARALCADLIARHVIPPQMLTRHLDIAIPAGRKTDPAGFPWASFVASLYPPATHRYRAITCAPIFQSRAPDAVLAGSIPAGQIEAMDDVTIGWIHLSSGLGFSPLGCWVPE